MIGREVTTKSISSWISGVFQSDFTARRVSLNDQIDTTSLRIGAVSSFFGLSKDAAIGDQAEESDSDSEEAQAWKRSTLAA